MEAIQFDNEYLKLLLNPYFIPNRLCVSNKPHRSPFNPEIVEIGKQIIGTIINLLIEKMSPLAIVLTIVFPILRFFGWISEFLFLFLLFSTSFISYELYSISSLSLILSVLQFSMMLLALFLKFFEEFNFAFSPSNCSINSIFDAFGSSLLPLLIFFSISRNRKNDFRSDFSFANSVKNRLSER